MMTGAIDRKILDGKQAMLEGRDAEGQPKLDHKSAGPSLEGPHQAAGNSLDPVSACVLYHPGVFVCLDSWMFDVEV